MRRGLWLAMVMAIALAAGCQKSADNSAADKPPVPAPASGSAAPAGSGSASGRPASVTDDEVKLADAYIAATEALANDVAAAGLDCKKATEAIKANVPKLEPMVTAGEKLRTL